MMYIIRTENSFRAGVAAIFLCFFLIGACAEAGPVDREPSDLYKKKIAPLLTPVEKVIPLAERYKDDESGVILLDEEIDYIAEDGAYYHVIHSINLANTEAGAEVLNRDSFRYRKSDQSITLVLAHTIQPDGSKDAVRANAAVIQDIVDAGNDLYEDRAELILIYPNVKAGSITESIIIKKSEKGFRVPGEYMNWVSAEMNIWPLCLKRTIIEVPEALAKRFHFAQLGTGVPKKKIEAVKGEARTRLSWEDRFEPRRRSEDDTPPSSQVGPAEFITTWKSWDDAAGWYDDLLKGRTDLGEELITKNQEWIKGKKSKDEIIQKLFSVVANDVRYVGLEFGIAGFQPYPCKEVWKNRYGDCKDKSTLLTSLLVHNGIEAYTVLVDTDHSGKVEKRWPSYQTFDHMIVAVKNADVDGGWMFLDPTLSRAPAGTVGQWVAGRDVLILKGKKAVWAKTPKTTAGELQFSFDLNLETSGNLSGWFEFDTKGYYASSYADDYSERGRQATIQSLQKLIRSFYPRADVVDIEIGEVKDSHETYRMRAFFNSPHPFPQGEGQPIRFSFPESNAVFPWLGNRNERSAPLFMWKKNVSVKIDVQIPDGWSPGRLPDPISMKSKFLESKGTWKSNPKENRIIGEFAVTFKQSEVPGNQFSGVYNAVNSLDTWMKHSAEFVPGKANPKAKQAKADESVTMEIMPTGEGQLNLVNVRYPLSGDHKARLSALRKVMQFFPDDKETRFSAMCQIAYLAYVDDKLKEAVKQVESALSKYGNEVEKEDRGWASYIHALGLSEIEGRKKEGIQEFSRLSKDEGLSDYRRCWAAHRAGGLLLEDDSKQAISIIFPLLKMEEERIPFLYEQYADACLRQGQSAELKVQLVNVIEQKRKQAGEIFSNLAELAKEQVFEAAQGDDKSEGLVNDGPALHEILASLDLSDLRESDSDLDEGMQELVNSVNSLSALKGLRSKFQKLVQSKKAPAWLSEGTVDEDLSTAEEFETALDELREGDAHDDFIATAATYLEKFPPRTRYTFFFWRFLSYVEWKERPAEGESGAKDEFFPKLAALSDSIPRSDENHWECQFVRATWYENHQLFGKEAALYREILDDPEFDDSFSVSAAYRMGTALEKTGEFEEAKEAYLRSEDEVDDVAQAVDGMFRAAFICLELRKEEEALILFDKLRAIEKEHRGDADYSVILELFLKLAADKKKAGEYWSHSAEWWPEWKSICGKLPGGKAAAEELLVGVIDDLDLYEENITAGSKGKGSPKLAKSYAQAAHMARWIPDYLPELGRITIFAVSQLIPNEKKRLRQLVVSAYDGIEPVDEVDDIAQYRLYYAVALADSPEKSVAVARDHFKKFPKGNDLYDQALARVWSISALLAKDGEAIKSSGKIIQAQLDDAAAFSERYLSVKSLANLLRRQKDFEGEKNLLEKELKNPAIRANTVSAQRLKTRLQSHIESGDQGAGFGPAVRKWIDSRDLEWLEFCEPKTLEDRRLKDPEAIVSKGSSRFNELEQIKAWLLIAEKSDITINSRWEAFRKAVDTLTTVARSYDKTHELYRSALSVEEIPGHLRAHYAFYGMVHAARKHQIEHFQEFREHKVIKKFWQPDDKRLKLLGFLVKADPFDSKARLAVAEKIWEDSVNQFEFNYLILIYAEMLSRGQEDEAEILRDSISDWQIDSGMNQSLASIKLGFLKVRKSYLENRNLNLAMSGLISDRLGFEEAASDEIAFPYDADALPSTLSIELGNSILLRAVKRGQTGFWNHAQWFRFSRALDYSSESMDLRFDIVKTCLKMTDDDGVRSFLLLGLSHIIDTDDKSNRERVENEILIPWEKEKNEAPLSKEAVRFYRTKIDRRTGVAGAIEKEFKSIKHPVLQSRGLHEILEHALVKKDNAMLKRTLDLLSTDDLVSEQYIQLSWLALEQLKRDGELELVKEEAVQIRNREMIGAWAEGDFGSAITAMELTDLLGDKEHLTKEWVNGFLQRNYDVHGRLSFQIRYAELNEDWSGVVRLAEEGVEKFPTYYHFYGSLGRAYFKLGDKKQARKPLETYVRYANDSIHHPEAVEMLKQAK